MISRDNYDTQIVEGTYEDNYDTIVEIVIVVIAFGVYE